MGVTGLAIATLLAAGLGAGAQVYTSHQQVKQSREAAKKYRDEMKKRTEEAAAERERLENMEKERRKKIAERGTQLPETILTSFAGVKPGPVGSKLLGGGS
jgi:predicted negative regulator of RcsB-dependent stress response